MTAAKKYPADRLMNVVLAPRNEHPALQSNWSLRFHEIENPQLLAYSKSTPQLDDAILTIVNLDPQWTQSGWVHLPLELLGIDVSRPYIAHDLLSGTKYEWFGPVNYVELNPQKINAHVFHLSQGE